MKFVMATEAQRLISISLAKIAASRCVRGGVSLHKNLLVATVLQKARYIFMEEAFHMVHGHYINQANSKFIQQLRHEEHIIEQRLQLSHKDYDSENNESASLNDSEIDLFTSSVDSNESLNFLHESNYNEKEILSKDSNNEINSSQTDVSSSELIYLNLDMNNKFKSSENCSRISKSTTGQKRRPIDIDSDFNESNDSPSPKSKQIKFSKNEILLTLNEQEESNALTIAKSCIIDSNNGENSKNIIKSLNISSDLSTDNCSSLDFLSNDINSVSDSNSKSLDANILMTPLDMSKNNSTSHSSTTNTTNLPISQISSSIDRITSLVSIFNFGNLQRSVSAPDLCSSSSSRPTVDNTCCNIQQRQIAMTV